MVMITIWKVQWQASAAWNILLYKQGDSEYKNGQYRYVNDPAILHNHFPVFAKIKAAYGEKRIPESGPDNRVDRKSNKIHSSHTGG